MSSGEARALHKANGLPVVIVGAHGRVLWSPVWEGIPYILKRYPGRRFNRLVNGGGVRPYIELKTATRWFWRPYTPRPAELVFTKDELKFAEPYRGMVMIEPNVKDVGHSNKAWIPKRWQQIVDSVTTEWVQCVQAGTQPLSAVLPVVTPTFRHAAAVLSVCKAFVGQEGGLHHAAAAVGTPAVVIFGGFIAPSVTGYSNHRNLFTGTGLGCGNRLNCKHCRLAMDQITVDRVAAELQSLLGKLGSPDSRVETHLK